jgi:hypothetical protein
MINSEIDFYGSSVTIIGKHSITYDEHGDESYSDHEICTKAVPNDVTGDEDFNTEGIFVPGDKIFFFKSTEDAEELVPEHVIQFNNIEYKIIQVVSHNIQNTQHQFEVRCKKI